MTEGLSKSFHYPDQKSKPAHRMCSEGQRRAALESVTLLREHHTGERSEDVTDILARGGRAKKLLERGATINKHDVISAVVVGAYADGILHELVTPDGDFLLETQNGTYLRRNVFEELQRGKKFY